MMLWTTTTELLATASVAVEAEAAAAVSQTATGVLISSMHRSELAMGLDYD